MQDACHASFNAVKALFQISIVLMCYFHVKLNLKKNKNLLPADLFDEFSHDVDELHYSTSEEIYKERLDEFKEKWNEHEAMMTYMNEQWFTGVFNQWQIYLNDPGYANTNSNNESFNSTFKSDYTKFCKCSILSACKKILECITYYSNSANNVWNTCPRYDKDLKERAKAIDFSCFIKVGGKKSPKSYIYKGPSSQYEIKLDDQRCFKSISCSCPYFIKWAICKHLIAYSNMTMLDLFGAKYRQPDRFVRKIKKGAPVNRTGRYPKNQKALVRE
jgi:hypothetical protein